MPQMRSRRFAAFAQVAVRMNVHRMLAGRQSSGIDRHQQRIAERMLRERDYAHRARLRIVANERGGRSEGRPLLQNIGTGCDYFRCQLAAQKRENVTTRPYELWIEQQHRIRRWLVGVIVERHRQFAGRTVRVIDQLNVVGNHTVRLAGDSRCDVQKADDDDDDDYEERCSMSDMVLAFWRHFDPDAFILCIHWQQEIAAKNKWTEIRNTTHLVPQTQSQ